MPGGCRSRGSRTRHRSTARTAGPTRPQHEATGSDHHDDDGHCQRSLAPWRPPGCSPAAARITAGPGLIPPVPLLSPGLTVPARAGLGCPAFSGAALGWARLGPAALGPAALG